MPPKTAAPKGAAAKAKARAAAPVPLPAPASGPALAQCNLIHFAVNLTCAVR